MSRIQITAKATTQGRKKQKQTLTTGDLLIENGLRGDRGDLLEADLWPGITEQLPVARDPPRILSDVVSGKGPCLDRSLGSAISLQPRFQKYRVLRMLPHSVRNARIGSIRDALHAGTRHASTDTTSRVAATAAKIAGSSGRVP